MKKLAIGAVGAMFGLAVALALPSFGQSSGSPSSGSSSNHTVTVQGTATIKSAPDEAVVSLGVQTSAGTAQAALQQNAGRMTHVIAMLTASGINKSDIATTDVSLYPQYSNTGNTIVGYQASNSIDVTVKDMTKVGKTIDLGVGAGANLTDGITFKVSDQNAGLNDALAAAVKDSHDKAQVLATAGGAQLGSVVSIDETNANPNPPVKYAYDYASAAGAAVPTPIRPPTMKTEIVVTVVWALT
jgi:uncharacterized protein